MVFLGKELAVFALRLEEYWLKFFENRRNVCGWGEYLNRNGVPNRRLVKRGI
jgi:hypothetical protein